MEKNKNLSIVIGIFVIVFLLVGFYIVYDKVFFSLEDSSKKSSVKSEEKKPSKDDDTGKQGTNASVCFGTYYGETSGVLPNGLTYDFKYTYVLNSDGTYRADFGGVSGNSGTYKIENGKVSFTHAPETTAAGVNEVVDTYAISADCTTITVNLEVGPLNLLRK